MMEALGLEQHVNFGTCNFGNTLYLIFMEIISDTRITKVTSGEFLSPQRLVECQLNLRRPHIIYYKKKIQMFRGINMEKILDAMKFDGSSHQFLR